jgi:hypothetical protein
VDGSHSPVRNVRGGMRKSFNFYLDVSLWSAKKRSLLIVGRNSLPTFGFNFVRCLTFHTNKQQLITLSRMAQSKDCTAASRTHFAHAPPRQHGPRSYPLCSSDSEHSRGKTLVFPQLKQFSVPKLSCQMNFCKMMNFQLTPLSKNFPKPCMFLPLLCLGTILAPSYPASCQPSCSPPPSSGSVWEAWFHPFSRSTTAPTRSCAAAPDPSPSESGRGTRWLLSAASRLAQPRASRLAARVAAVDRRARAQAVWPQPSGSRSQTRWSLHLPLHRRRHATVPEPFSYPVRRFLHTRDRRRLHSLHRRGTRLVNGHRPRGWTSDLFSSQPRPELGGSPVERWLHPC